jgi:hypothetical protein
MIISNKIKFFGFYFYNSDYNKKNHKFNILLIGNKSMDGSFILSKFVSRYDIEDNINYSYHAIDLKMLHEILNEIFSKIKNPKNKFILMCEDDIDMDQMTNILDKWRNNIIISNKEHI